MKNRFFERQLFYIVMDDKSYTYRKEKKREIKRKNLKKNLFKKQHLL